MVLRFEAIESFCIIIDHRSTSSAGAEAFTFHGCQRCIEKSTNQVLKHINKFDPSQIVVMVVHMCASIRYWHKRVDY